MRETTEVNSEATVQILFSRSGKEYYVTGLDHHRPTAWVAVEPDDDGTYKVWPFAFYSIKGGETKQVPESDPLVQRYAEADKWPVRGSNRWRDEIRRARETAERNLTNERRSVEFYEREIARLDALIAGNGGNA